MATKKTPIADAARGMATKKPAEAAFPAKTAAKKAPARKTAAKNVPSAIEAAGKALAKAASAPAKATKPAAAKKVVSRVVKAATAPAATKPAKVIGMEEHEAVTIAQLRAVLANFPVNGTVVARGGPGQLGNLIVRNMRGREVAKIAIVSKK